MANRRLSKILRIVGITLLGLVLLGLAGFGILIFNHRQDVERAEEAYRSSNPEPLGDIGTTDALTILPLVDWHASDDEFATDMGVSYLVKTDDRTILFDTGNNSKGTEPSPLERNMETLGVTLDDIDTVVISHAHFDHVGGRQWTDGDISGTTFGIGDRQPDLSGKDIFVPTDMTYPGADPQVATEPVRISDGVTTTGTIPRQLFIGRIDEQSLAVHVAGKGIVLIVGCGHQTLTKLIERTEQVFDTPIYGVIGGLHYPVPHGRIQVAGFLDVQRLFASGKGPLSTLDQEEVDAELNLLAERNPGVVSIGGHDSSDDVIAAAKEQFGSAYRHLRVGEPIEVP